MLVSADCWMKSYCKKGLDPNSECNIDNDAFCKKLFKLEYLFTESLLPKPLWKKELLRLDESRVDEQAFIQLQNIQNDIENFVKSGNNLYIYSSITGNGKSAWAIRLLQSYFNSIWYKSDLTCKGLFVSVPRYLLSIKDNITQYNEYANKIKDNILNVDIVIWDDIGTKTATSFEHENLLSIIDYRMNDSKCNIFTSNLTPQELNQVTGDRLYSRIINFSNCIPFYGSDKRGLKL